MTLIADGLESPLTVVAARLYVLLATMTQEVPDPVRGLVPHPAPPVPCPLPEAFRPLPLDVCQTALSLPYSGHCRFLTVCRVYSGQLYLNDGERVTPVGPVSEAVAKALLGAMGECGAVVVDRRSGRCWSAPNAEAIEYAYRCNVREE